MSDLSKRIANISPEKQSLLRKKLKEKKIAKSIRKSIPRRENTSVAPLSYAQQRLWFLNQLEPDSPFYNISQIFRVHGTINIESLRKALNAIIDRHETLRTTFKLEGEQPVQVILSSIEIDLPVVDLRKLDESKRESELKKLVVEEAQRPFKLSVEPLIRCTLLRLDNSDHVLLLTMHHIISDGWSMGIFKMELSTFYNDFVTGLSPTLGELPIQYVDFAYWQRQWLKGEALEKQLSYWTKLLEGAPSLLELPTDSPRPVIQSYRGARESIILPCELSEEIKSLSRHERGTPFMTMLAAFKVLLYRYTGVDDILVGTPIANRTRVEIENLIGFFVNTLVLRSSLSGNPSFRKFLHRVREGALEAYAHQDLPFEKLVEEMQPERSLSYSPLFQVMFAFQNAPSGSLEMSNLTLTRIEVDPKISKFDLSLFINETDQGLRVMMEYNSDIFNKDTIRRMLGHFKTLLESIANDPDSSICTLPILTKREQDQVLLKWNNTKTDYPHNKCIHQLFEIQVEKSPDAVAVVYEDDQLTYRELNELSNQLAHYLRKQGVGPDVLVGICMERCLEMVIGILGILKSDGACVPMDPSYPAERLTFMMVDTQIPIILTTKSLLNGIPHHGAKIVCLSDDEIIREQSKENPLTTATSDNLVYVIYTSGSTGQPKGVALPHHAIFNLISWQLKKTTLSEGARTLQFTSLSFDVSFQEIFTSLCSGGSLIMIPESIRQDMENVATFIANKKIDRLFLPFVALQQLAEVIQRGNLCINLREVITAGEQLQITPAIYELFSQLKKCSFSNQYGPSESHVVTAYTLGNSPEDWPHLPPIGRPIDNTKVYITDSNLQPVPIGVTGELLIGGVALGRGYLNLPDMTKEKFVSNPFSKDTKDRIYKTGDLVRYLPDGNIEFLGRIDNQVKIRGYRIELGEIEANLAKHPGVKQVVVLAREDEPGNKRLVAYIVSKKDSNPSTSELRNFLKKKLPEYMIPSVFMMLESLPITPNGKVDRKALPAPDQKRPGLDKEFVAPSTSTEIKLSDIWCRLLNLKEVGVNDNFFELGGHSLLATQLISRIADAFQVELPLRVVFECPVIAEIALKIEQIKEKSVENEELGRLLDELEGLSEGETQKRLKEN